MGIFLFDFCFRLESLTVMVRACILTSKSPRLYPSLPCTRPDHSLPLSALHSGRVVSNFVIQALRGEPLTIYGDGSQTRSFMFIHDLVDGLISLMNTEAPDAHAPVNLGNETEFTVKELVDVVQEVVEEIRREREGESEEGRDEADGEAEAEGGSKAGNGPAAAENSVGSAAAGYAAGPSQPPAQADESAPDLSGLSISSDNPSTLTSSAAPSKKKTPSEIIYLPMPIDDPQQRRPDTTRARKLLDWTPKWKLKEGLREMAEYYWGRMEEGVL